MKSPTRIKPSLSVKVCGKDRTGLMPLKTFLQCKKSENEEKQA